MDLGCGPSRLGKCQAPLPWRFDRSQRETTPDLRRRKGQVTTSHQNIVRKRFLWVLKNTLNRVTTQMARNGLGPFSLIHHVGRRSGRDYETPVILAKVPEGFIAELTYGDQVDWYRNVVVAGGCRVVYRGKEYRVNRIELRHPEE